VCRYTAEEEHTAELEESCPSSGSVTDSEIKLDADDCPNTLLNVGSGVDLLELIFCSLAIAGRESELFACSPTSKHPFAVYIVTRFMLLSNVTIRQVRRVKQNIRGSRDLIIKISHSS